MRQQVGRGRRLQIPESSAGPAVVPGTALGAQVVLAQERRGRDGSFRGPAAHEQAAGTGAAPAALTPPGSGGFQTPPLSPCAADKRNKKMNTSVWFKRIRCWKGWRRRRTGGQNVKSVIFLDKFQCDSSRKRSFVVSRLVQLLFLNKSRS